MPKVFTIAEALAIIRSKLNVGQEVGLVLYAHEKYLLVNSTKLGDVYERYKDQDGFLYLTYAEQEIYG